MASASAPVGSPPPPFFMIFQNIEWFPVAAAIVPHSGTNILRDAVEA